MVWHDLIEFYHIIGINSFFLFIEENIIYLPVAVLMCGVYNGCRDFNNGQFRFCPNPVAIFVELGFFFVPVVIEVCREGGEFLTPLYVSGIRKHCLKGQRDWLGCLLNSIFTSCQQKSDCEKSK